MSGKRVSGSVSLMVLTIVFVSFSMVREFMPAFFIFSVVW